MSGPMLAAALLLLTGAGVLAGYILGCRSQPSQHEPVEPEVQVTLTINGRAWDSSARWEYLRDRETAVLALIDLAKQVQQQERA